MNLIHNKDIYIYISIRIIGLSKNITKSIKRNRLALPDSDLTSEQSYPGFEELGSCRTGINHI